MPDRRLIAASGTIAFAVATVVAAIVSPLWLATPRLLTTAVVGLLLERWYWADPDRGRVVAARRYAVIARCLARAHVTALSMSGRSGTGKRSRSRA